MPASSDGGTGARRPTKNPEPPAAAQVGQAWMRMLTLQLGILLKPYLASTE